MLQAPQPSWQTYRLFGETFASPFAFTTPLQPANTTPTFTFTCIQGEPPLPTAPPYQRPAKDTAGQYPIYLYRLDNCTLLRCAYAGDFYIWPHQIICHLVDPEWESGHVESYFLSPIFSFWLEQHHIPTLHASAVALNGQLIAFLAHSGHGKSTLAATLLQTGALFVTDDILPIEQRDGRFYGRPGYPQMRLWPTEAQYFLGSYHQLPPVFPLSPKRQVSLLSNNIGRPAESFLPLSFIYLPQRLKTEEPTQIIPISRSEAVIELFRYSFFPDAIQQLNHVGSRLDFFSQMVQSVPLRRLLYPSGLTHLNEIRQAILSDTGG